MNKMILTAAAVLMILPAAASAKSNKMAHGNAMHAIAVGDLEIMEARLRATPPNGKAAAGYLTIHNSGEKSDRLVGGSAALTQKLQIHEMSMSDGVMKMRPLVDGLEIRPDETVELKPGGYHLMLIGLEGGLSEGETRSVTVEFENAGSVELDLPVVPFGTTGHGEMKSGHEGH